ncbi:MAG: hypothetical protein K0R29_1931, partial [Pseudobdellovibrio sp.]|nr:hypothetical protein [Pseudobdellovibrio sp.]
ILRQTRVPAMVKNYVLRIFLDVIGFRYAGVWRSLTTI